MIRPLLLLFISLLLCRGTFALTKAERMALMGLCTLAEHEAESGDQLRLLAARCLIEEGRVNRAIAVLSKLKNRPYKNAALYLLRGVSLELEVEEPSKNKDQREEETSPEQKAIESFYSGNYTAFFQELEAFPELKRKPNIRKLMALAYYRMGQYSFALATLASNRNPFSCFWRWKIKRKLGLDTTEERLCLEKLPITSFYGILYRLVNRIPPSLKIDPPEPEDRCPIAIILQKSGLDRRSLDALKDCAASEKEWIRVIPLLPNPYPAIRLLYALRGDWKERLSYSYIRPHLTEVRLACWAYQVDEDLAYAIMRQESLFDRYALSRSRAMGLMQIIPSTAVWISKENLKEAGHLPKYFLPFFSIKYGIWYLGHLQKSFDVLSIAAYNSGPTRLRKWLDKNMWVEDISDVVEFYPIAETRTYVKKVLVNYYLYKFIF